MPGPGTGINAIHEAGAILDVLRGYMPRQPEVDGLTYHEGLNAVFISGGVAGNVIPDECVVTVNFRFAPDRTVAQAQDHVRAVFAGWEVTFTDAAAGARPGLADPAAASLIAAVGGVPRAKLGWTDVARFAALGMPAVNYGPGDPEVAHSRGEHVPIAQIGECEDRLRTWLASDRRPVPGWAVPRRGRGFAGHCCAHWPCSRAGYLAGPSIRVSDEVCSARWCPPRSATASCRGRTCA